MPELEVLSPALSTTILTLGVVFVAAAIIGGGLEAAGTKIPAIAGWRRQVGAALFGLALVGFGWSALQAAYWHDDYMALVNGMSSTPPFPPQTVQDRLNTLASNAGDSYSRNCLVAEFIYDHNVDIPLAVKLALLRAQTSPSHALQCYLQIEKQAAQSITTSVAAAAVESGAAAAATPAPPPQKSAGAPAPTSSAGSLPFTDATPAPASAAPPTSAERILAAITRPGLTGWVYLGENAGGGQLGAKRTVQESAPRVGGSVTTAVAVHLRDPSATAKFKAAPVVGVVPKGTTLAITDLRGTSGRFEWARVRVVSQP